MGGENLPTTTQENDVNIDIPQRRGMSGSYLFRSKKESTDGDREKKSNRRGGYLFRTKKMGRYTRGMYSFIYLILDPRTSQDMDRALHTDFAKSLRV